MSFHGGSAANDVDESGGVGRKGRRLSIGSFGRLGLRRSSSLRRILSETEHDSDSETSFASSAANKSASTPGTTDGSAPAVPPAASDAPTGRGFKDEDGDAAAFSSDDESTMFSNDGDEMEDEEPMFDDSTIRNTMVNAQMLPGSQNHAEITNYEDEDLLDPSADEFQTAPNIVFARNEKELLVQKTLLTKNSLPVTQPGRPTLVTHGPTLERNRCTVIMTYGDYETHAKQSRRKKRYIVASDSSEGSQYAINWAMGTVLRDGDEILIVAVIDADAKAEIYMDKYERYAGMTPSDRALQEMTIFLCHQAFVLLQRTRLNVKIGCQSVHSINARHMLLDIIDFYSPTMVIVGSRGVDGIRGMLGSMSHYLVQKSSKPVMVCHNKLQLPRLPRGKADVVKNVRMRHTRLDQAVVEKYTSKRENPEDDEEDKGESPAERMQREQLESERMNRLNRESYQRRENAGSGVGPGLGQNPSQSSSTSPVPEEVALTDEFDNKLALAPDMEKHSPHV